MSIRCKLFPYLILFCAFFLLSSTLLHAQNQEQQDQNGTGNGQQQPQNAIQGTNFELSPFGYYYQDQIGLTSATQVPPMEGYIDQSKYVLGPQDILSIDIRGGMALSLRGIAVNPVGNITLPTIGQINVRNLTLSEASEKIKQAVGENFKKSEVSVTLDIPRKIVVHVTGDIPKPGRYLIPAQTRVDAVLQKVLTFNPSSSEDLETQKNANFLTNHTYDLRNIEIFNGDTLRSKADLVAYLRGGELQSDPFLHSGDVILISRILEKTPRISISGAVRAPIELEYKNSDSIQGLIQIAGGYSSNADTNHVFVYRPVANDIKRLIIDHNSDVYKTFTLRPNDRVVVPRQYDDNSSASSWVYGEANNPGDYPIISGKTTVFNLLNMAGGITANALPQGAYLIRSINSVPNVNKDIANTSDELKRTSDQTTQGLQYLDLETKIDRNQVYVNLNDTLQLKTIHVYDGDRLFIPRDEHTVYLFGQVNHPGYYTFNDNMTVTSYISQAGGMTIAANPKRVYVIKAGSKTWYKPDETQLQSGDMIFVDRVPYEDVNQKRNYKLQLQNLLNSRISLILSAISTTVLILNFVKFK